MPDAADKKGTVMSLFNSILERLGINRPAAKAATASRSAPAPKRASAPQAAPKAPTATTVVDVMGKLQGLAAPG